MPSVSPYDGIVEVEEARTVDEANILLKNGWVLVKVIEKTNTDGSTSIIYVLGRTGETPKPKMVEEKPVEKPQKSPEPQSFLVTEQEQKALESLNWRQFKVKDGEWAFYADPIGELLPELEPVAKLIQKLKSDEKQKITLGNYTYSIRGKFIVRTPLK